MTLPFVDEHSVEVRADRAELWRAILDVVGPAAPGAGAVAALLGCQERAERGERGAPGSTLVGFRVARANPGAELALEGEHRFSRYALTFAIEEEDGRLQLHAVTHAAFPGPAGRLYRALVIGSGAHGALMPRLLGRIRATAEGVAG